MATNTVSVHSRRLAWPSRVLRWLSDAYKIALQNDASDGYAVLTPREVDRHRRAALLRVSVLSITLFELCVALPASLLTLPLVSLAVLLVVGIGVLSLWLNEIAMTDTAGVLYMLSIFVSLYTGIIFGLPGSEETRLGLLFFATVFLLLGGLILPTWAIWGSGVVVLAGSETLLFLLPPATIFGPDNVATAAIRLPVLAGFIGFAYVLTTILAWLSARASRAGVEQLARSLEQEQELIALKDLFILSANHELRTPIMTLTANIELLSESLDVATPQERQQMLVRSLRAGRDLQRLLGNVLDAGVAESEIIRHLNLEPLRVLEAVQEAFATFAPHEVGEIWLEQTQLMQRPTSVDVPENLWITADKARIRQVLINLLSNALKYSAPGTPLRISAQQITEREVSRRHLSKETRATWVKVSVRDWGFGVPPREQGHLFQRFVRLERDAASATRGTGVGLYLCRIVIEAMGGDIWVESSGIPGEGSTFTFLVPLAGLTW